METKDIKFKDYPLSNEIKRGLSELGFKKPLEVQGIVIPRILKEDKDLIVKSQTGSGKTAAYSIPICEKIDMELEATQMLVLTPTRELAQQVKYDIDGIGKYKEIICAAVFGKQPIEVQRMELKRNPHVIAATPGRMMDHLKRKNIKLNNLKYLVIDEADEMLLMGFGDQIEAIVDKLPKERVTLLFSATMPDKVQTLSRNYMTNPENIEVKSKVNTLDKIEQIYYSVEALKKVDFLKKMLKRERPRKTIIFCNTQEQVERLYAIMKKWSRLIGRVHGGMDQRSRMDKLTGFKKGQYDTLIATDVAARGIHVENITHVVNFFVPFDNENYIHRIGRTGRVDKGGIAITFVTQPEENRFLELQDFLGYKIPCKGGHVQRKVGKKDLKKAAKKTRYKPGKVKGSIVQINAGRSTGRFTNKDILSALRSIGGVTQDNIGKIDIKDKFTTVEILGGKERIIVKALKGTRIKGKLYRAKIKN
jgi:superfamily II DNA/RNA helicase